MDRSGYEFSGGAWPGMAGKVRHGVDGPGTDSSGRRGVEWRGWAGHGMTWRCEARQANETRGY